jgi:hypothetical protein
MNIFLTTLLTAAAYLPGVVIDDSPTRVQTDIKIDMEIMGTLKPKSVSEISSSRWTLDCGGMDREHADWRAVRGYVAPLGIARIRQQAGWARCEKEPGMYDFAWLDQCVLDAKQMGVDVWMELSYGNPIYKGGGGRNLNAGFPTSEEGLAAWDRWAKAMAEHYKGVVVDWCIWNEPNGKTSGNTIEQAIDFAIRTAEILRAIIPDAKIAAFALTEADPAWIEPFVKALAERGKAQLFNTIAYHHYNHNPDEGYDVVETSRKIVARYTPNISLMEGEGGTQSEWCRNGALGNTFWTELTQAKYDLRRSLGDLGHGDDTEVFHLCDLEYRAVKRHWGLLRYGLLKTTGQADGFRVLKVKTAYYAIQNAVSVFNDALECLSPASTTSTLRGGGEETVIYDWKDKATGTPVVVFWNATNMPSKENVTIEGRVSIKGTPISNPVWVDVLTGNVYKIDEAQTVKNKDGITYDVPVYDSPAFITSMDILNLDQSWYVREGKTMIQYH